MKDTDYQMVEYSNHITTATAGFTAYELDVFLIVIYMAKQKIPRALANKDDDLVVNLSIKELKSILRENGNSSPKRIKEALTGVFDAKFFFKKDKYLVHQHLFKEMQIHTEKDEINFVIKKEYKDMFFNLTGNFTQHSILVFGSLKSRYAKRIYQIIMGYKHIGFEADADIFRTALEIPKSYQWVEIERILKPAVKELLEKTEIATFKMVKIKTGRKVTKIKLEWTFKNDVQEEKKENIEPEILNSKKEVDIEVDTVKPLTEEEADILKWIFENTSVKSLPGRKESEIYIKMARGLIKNFYEGGVKVNA